MVEGGPRVPRFARIERTVLARYSGSALGPPAETLVLPARPLRLARMFAMPTQQCE
jgi:hypothetical protein